MGRVKICVTICQGGNSPVYGTHLMSSYSLEVGDTTNDHLKITSPGAGGEKYITVSYKDH